ncbi:MAG: ABC transporter permease [Treponema sp.]|nr:ABC transporter permease [Treponema sp.]
MGAISKLALKNLSRQKKRNVVLGLAVAFGFFVITGVDGFISGMVNNLEEQITQLLGGTVLIQGCQRIPSELTGGKPQVAALVEDDAYIRDVVEKTNIDYDYVSYYSLATGQLIFEGKKSLIEVYGRDLYDKHLLDSFQFVSGGSENYQWENPFVISDSTAKSLNLEVGDKVTFTCSTIYGQNNVEDFTVAGIIKSNNFFGSMMGYTDIKVLNKLLGIPDAGYSTFTIHLKNKNKQALTANQIQQKIAEDGHLVTDRTEAFKTNPKNIGKGIEKQLDPVKVEWEGTKYAVECFNDELPAIQSVFFYVHVIMTVILIVMLVIVMIGLSNTYRMVMYERIREIGTMRAIGMTRDDTKDLFLREALFLTSIAALIGLVIAIIVLSILSLIPINSDALSMFLNNGHFTYKLSAVTIILQYALLIVLTLLSVDFVARKAASLNPAVALRTIK